MRFTASSYRYRRGCSAKNDGGPGYSGSKAQNGYKPTRMLLGLDFVANKTESPLDGISKNVTYKLVPTDLPSSPTGDMLTADLEIVTPLSACDEGWQPGQHYLALLRPDCNKAVPVEKLCFLPIELALLRNDKN